MADAHERAAGDSHIEAAIAQFEAAWLQGKRPVIEEFLPASGSGGDAAGVDPLLWELVHAELEFRVKTGEAARVEEYLARFPQLASDRKRLAELVRGEYDLARRRKPGVELAEYLARFPDLADELQTQLRAPAPPRRRSALRLNCPHCQNPIEIVADETSEELVCPSCGSNFHLEREKTLTWNAERLPKLGKFELIAAVGRGAFGTVYRAKDTQLDRIVAVKLPRSGTLGTEADEDRFIRDARSTAQLRHPGIVPVFEVGRSETFPYIVMEFVEGSTLADVLTAKRLSFRESAELMMKVAEALEHAHQQGVVHRDLKPSNIMLSPDGTPRLMDFGLAKRDAGEITMTLDGQILGTPAYMSPEQAAGEAHKADARSDIYSLGVILYQLLTGELPFRGNMRMLVQQVLHDEPRAPRKLNDRVPKDLDTICLKAMAKQSSRRYGSAQELAADLGRYRNGSPVLARPVGRILRSWRWVKRNRTMSTSAMIVFLLLTTVMIVSAISAIRVGAERRRADQKAAAALAAAEDSERQKELLRLAVYASNIKLAERAWEDGDVRFVNELLTGAIPNRNERDLRGWEWYFQQRLCQSELRTLKGHIDEVSSVAFSPDGRRLASASNDQTVKLWDSESGAELRTLKGHTSGVSSVAFSPDGRRLASASDDQTIKLWDAESGAELRTLKGHTRSVGSVAFSPDGRRLASASFDQTIKLWDATLLTPDEKTARFLVNQLWEDLPDPRDLADAVRARSNWPEPMRTAALEYIERIPWKSVERHNLLSGFRDAVQAANWSDVAKRLTRLLKISDGSEQSALLASLALAKLGYGDEAGYREACARLWDRAHSNGQDVPLRAVALVCTAGPKALDDLRPLVAAIDAVRMDGRDTKQHGTVAYYIVVPALAARYRAGAYEQVVKAQATAEIGYAVVRGTPENASVAWLRVPHVLFSAMAYQRLGQTEQAAKWLKIGQEAHDKIQAEIGQQPPGEPALTDVLDPSTGQCRLMMSLLRREAETQINGSSHP